MFVIKSMSICNDYVNYDEITSFKYIFLTFIFLGYLRRTSNYLERIELYDLIHIMRIVDLIAISVKTLKIRI